MSLIKTKYGVGLTEDCLCNQPLPEMSEAFYNEKNSSHVWTIIYQFIRLSIHNVYTSGINFDIDVS